MNSPRTNSAMESFNNKFCVYMIPFESKFVDDEEGQIVEESLTCVCS